MAIPRPASELETRDLILGQLRFAPRTVDELAREVGLTPNGVRSHLAVLERDRLVERRGVRHGEGAGKPPLLYGATAHAEAQYSQAYAPALTGLVEALRDRLDGPALRATFAAAGKKIAGTPTSAPAGAPARIAQSLLESLGAAVTVSHAGGHTEVEGAACPLADAVRQCPESCEVVRSLLAARTGAKVSTRCHHGDSPRCRFRIG